MSGTAKEKDDACNNYKEDEHHITCTDDMKSLHITCTKIMCTKEVEEVDACANCGKGGEEASMNACNKCDLVVYCNAACKKKHRSKHKKKCERRVAELYDERLFKQPPLKKDCPICMLPLPSMNTGSKYYSCCGKTVCSGCIHAPIYDNLGNIIGTGEKQCPFCRTPRPTSNEEEIKTLKKRAEVGDVEAIFGLGCCYDDGIVEIGLPQDHEKALELYHRAGELGYADAYYNIGSAYHFGEGVERDEKKADHYYELAAMGGLASARHNLGCAEARTGNWDRALKHYMISVGGGYNNSMKVVHHSYKHGRATKDDYTKALLAYQKYLDEVRSEQRDKAAAFSAIHYKYY